ncbi:MAG: MBL fold metallo-hydrolase [Deltaproteobacteria bacterium RIFOXYD12_FULL_56_24]|nr:MAG: MBL fold metallo-hydrolase [Deltaproteobacteria bacterium RIFOXYD12_FULL_56_24]
MRFCVLGGGSKGNATFVESGQTRLLIDAGFSGKEIERRLLSIDVEPETLSGILITHEHGDHVKGAAILSRRFRLPVFINEATLAAAGPVLANLPHCQPFVTGEPFSFKDFQIHPFAISHDAADPVGFLLNNGRLLLGYCTDTGMVSKLIQYRLSVCHGLVLEANHDPDLLRTGPYPLPLQQRVRGKTGHLANAEAAGFLCDIHHDGLEHVVLSHLSETNNRPHLAEEAMVVALATLRDRLGDGCLLPTISLAHQDQVGEVVILGARAGR